MSHHRPAARSAAALLVILAASGTAAIRSGAKPAVVPAPHAIAAFPDSWKGIALEVCWRALSFR